MTDNELEKYLLKEVDLIQDIIRRMAQNSFLIKGWAITLVVVTLLLKSATIQITLAFIPIVLFWFLDSYFLQQERMYRKLYQWVITHRSTNGEHLLNMDASRFAGDVQSKFRIMFSITLGFFYGGMSILVAIYYFYLLFYPTT